MELKFIVSTNTPDPQNNEEKNFEKKNNKIHLT